MSNESIPPLSGPSQGDENRQPPTQGVTSPSQGDESRNSIQAIEELKAKLSELERDNHKYRKERRQQEETMAVAEQARLKEQGEFKQLAEQHEARVRELEPQVERLQTLASLVNTQIKAQIKDWPATVKVFDPGEDAPIEQRLAWVEKSKPLIEQLQIQAKGQQPGNGPNPRPTASTPDDARNEMYEKARKSGRYNIAT
jgi:hypothetical protein